MLISKFQQMKKDIITKILQWPGGKNTETKTYGVQQKKKQFFFHIAARKKSLTGYCYIHVDTYHCLEGKIKKPICKQNDSILFQIRQRHIVATRV